MTIRHDISIVENINKNLLIAEKIKTIQTEYKLDNNTLLDIDYQTVLELLSVYKDILQARPFVKVVGQNSQKVSYPDFLQNPDNFSVDFLTSKIEQYKQDTIVEHSHLANSIDNKYKRSSTIISKYGYNKTEPILPQIKARVTGYLHPTSLLSSKFDTNKIQIVRQQLTDRTINPSLINSSINTSLKNIT